MLDRLHKTVKFLSNTEGRGNVRPEDIDLSIHHRVQEKYEELLFEVNRLVNRQNRGLINGALENTTEKVREKIQHYLEDKNEIVSEGVLTIPKEVRYFDTLLFESTYVELCKDNKEFLMSKSEATEAYPIGLKTTNTVRVFPISIDSVRISYLRNPAIAKWTYDVIEGTELYNPSKNGFKEIDIHPSEETDLILRVLQSFGINLKEPELQKITAALTATEFTKENTN